MIEMKLSMKQNPRKRERSGGCQGGEGWGRDRVGDWG